MEQFKTLQQTNAEQATNFQAERDSLVAEVAHLRSALQGAESVVDTGQERVDTMERELRAARAQISSDAEARRILEARNGELLEDSEKQRSVLADALADATEQVRRADKLYRSCHRWRRNTRTSRSRKNSTHSGSLLCLSTRRLRCGISKRLALKGRI